MDDVGQNHPKFQTQKRVSINGKPHKNWNSENEIQFSTLFLTSNVSDSNWLIYSCRSSY